MEAHYNNLNKKLDNIQSKRKGNTKTQSNSEGPQFYPRTVNLTITEFTKEEIHVLNHGLQDSIEKLLETYWTNLIMETERAIKLVHPKLQDSHRILAAKKKQQISNSSNQNRANQKRQFDVFLTVHHSIDFFKLPTSCTIPLFCHNMYVTLRSLTCFEQHAAHHQEDKLYHHSLWYRHPL